MIRFRCLSASLADSIPVQLSLVATTALLSFFLRDSVLFEWSFNQVFTACLLAAAWRKPEFHPTALIRVSFIV